MTMIGTETMRQQNANLVQQATTINCYSYNLIVWVEDFFVELDVLVLVFGFAHSDG